MANDIVTNDGLRFIANRILGIVENPLNTSTTSFNVSNGVNNPSANDKMSDFNSDGDVFNKTISSISYDEVKNEFIINLYLSSVEANDVASITKLAIDNDDGAGKLIQEHKFTAIPKNDGKELYFTVKLKMKDNS